jgi:hypothetical protein
VAAELENSARAGTSETGKAPTDDLKRLEEMIAERQAAIREGASETWTIRVSSARRDDRKSVMIVEVDLTYRGRPGKVRAPAVSLLAGKGEAVPLASVSHQVLFVPGGGRMTGEQLDALRKDIDKWLMSGSSAKPRSLKLATNDSHPVFLLSFPLPADNTGLSLRFGDVPPIALTVD